MSAITKTLLLQLILLFSLLLNAQRYSVLIHEIMSDPQPSAGLPDAEYIELRNKSPNAINLSGWRLVTASSNSGLFPTYLLQPDSMVVVTGRINAALFSHNTIGISSFPALPNTGTLLQLIDASGNVVHAVNYESRWYGNAVKQEGGWSLEMIDAANPCSGAANWKAATAQAGGTPGKINSVTALNPDITSPVLLSATVTDSTHLLLRFDEPMDSNALLNPAHYLFEPAISVVHAQPLLPLCDAVVLTLSTPLKEETIYTIAAKNISDCAGNMVQPVKVKTGMPQTAQLMDVVINEILFNPKSDATDYVELYNRSNKIIDVSKLWIANTSAGAVPQKITADARYLFPGDYLVITEDRDAVLRSYLVKEEKSLISIPHLPALPDDKGSFVLLNEQGVEVDGLSYAENWHFALIANSEGVALERIDPDKPTGDKNNWTSAAASAGFGTPTYRNTQYRQTNSPNATIDISPKIFSPDNDGFDDFCTIQFQLTAPNFVANVFVFDADGRKVRQLVHNQTLAQSGSWQWDGLGEHRQILESGTYILLIELFNLQGKKQQAKLAVTLARKR